MKKLLLGAAVVAISFGVSEAKAEGFYVSGSLGATIPNDSDYVEQGVAVTFGLETALNAAAAVGYQFNKNIRSEFEISYRESGLDSATYAGNTVSLDGENKTWGFLVNGYYDFYSENTFSPYVMAGIGALSHDTSATFAGMTVSGDDVTFGYQVGAGVSYKITEAVKLDANYHYLGSGDIEYGDGASAEYGAHELRAGLRYSF